MFRRVNPGSHPFQLSRLLWLENWPNLFAHESSGWVVGICVFLNLAISIPLAYKLNIWIDEAYTLNTTSKGLEYALYQSITFEEQAPFYFVLLTLWRQISTSIFFARLFSVACISLTIFLASVISKKLFKNLHPGWLTALVAFNPFIIWAAVEIRLYAFSILLSATLLLLFLEAYWSGKQYRGTRWLFVLVAAVSVYTHYFLGFLLIAQGATLLISGRWKSFFAYLLDMAIVSILFLPMVMAVARQVHSMSDNASATGTSLIGDVGNPFAEGVKNSFLANLRYILPDRIDSLSSSLYRLIRFGLLFSLMFLGFRYRRYLNSNVVVVWLITLMLSTVFLIAFALLPAFFHPRHNMVLFIPAMLSVVATISLVPGRTRTQVLGLYSIVLIGLYAATLSVSYAPFAKTGDYERAAAYIKSFESPGQPILVFNPEVEMTLQHYYRGANKLIALPKPESFEDFNWGDLVVTNQQEIVAALSKAPDHRTVWLFMDNKWLKNSNLYHKSYEIIEAFVEDYYTVEMSHDFYGSSLRLLKQKSDF